MEKLIELYTHWANEKPAQVEKVEGAGSNRQYYRFTNTRGKTVIGVIVQVVKKIILLSILQIILIISNCLCHTYWQ